MRQWETVCPTGWEGVATGGNLRLTLGGGQSQRPKETFAGSWAGRDDAGREEKQKSHAIFMCAFHPIALREGYQWNWGASEEQLRDYMTILKVQRGMLINFQQPGRKQGKTKLDIRELAM
jgi:hypothetical protein